MCLKHTLDTSVSEVVIASNWIWQQALNKQHCSCLTHFHVFFERALNVRQRQQNFRHRHRLRRFQHLWVENYWNSGCCRQRKMAENPSFETWPELQTFHSRMTPFDHKQTVQLKTLFLVFVTKGQKKIFAPRILLIRGAFDKVLLRN